MSEFQSAIDLARETIASLDEDIDQDYALKITTMAYSWLMHIGHSTAWIREAEAESCGPHVGCERQDVFMLHEDENGEPHHPKLDELSEAFETARPMLEALIAMPTPSDPATAHERTDQK